MKKPYRVKVERTIDVWAEHDTAAHYLAMEVIEEEVASDQHDTGMTEEKYDGPMKDFEPTNEKEDAEG